VMEVDAKAGLNHAVWPFSRIISERSAEDMERMKARFERFGMNGSDLEERMAASKYVTGPVTPGTFQVVLEAGGKTITKEAVVMKDYWTNK